jgi:hypothetical protein
MKKYLGVKLIEAEPQKKNINIDRSVGDNPEKFELQDGYKVVYEDGYESWSPKEVFEKAYREINNLTFGLAIEALKKGNYIARKGWNGKGMYIFLIGSDMYKNNPGIGGWTYTNGRNDNTELAPFIAMKTVDEKVVPWLASQTDILAEDWEIIN